MYKYIFQSHKLNGLESSIKEIVSIWPVTGQGLENAKWPAADKMGFFHLFLSKQASKLQNRTLLVK